MLVVACSKNDGEVTLDEPGTTNPGITEPVQEVAKDIFSQQAAIIIRVNGIMIN